MKNVLSKWKKKTFDPNEILIDQNEIEIDLNKIGIYLNETEFYVLFIFNQIILVADLIYDYAK